jgi:hypothetical protein
MVAAGALIAQQVAGRATRDALFLSTFDVSRLPLVMIVAAGVSALAVLGFSAALSRRPPARVLPLAVAAGPPRSRMTLLVFTSPWSNPWPWMAASAWQRSRPMAIASGAPSAPPVASRSSRVSPSMSSVHNPTRPSRTSAPWTISTLE